MGQLGRISWWQWVPIPWRRWRIVAAVEAADEVPINLPSRGVVLVGSPNQWKWLAFDCPCNATHRIMVPVDPRMSPRWAVIAVKPLSIAPSFDFRTATRRCHFFVTCGQTVWVHQN